VESGGVEASARDEGGRAAGDLRNRRAQERGGDGVGGRGGCERREESAGEDQSGEGAGASGVAGGGEGEQVVRGFSFGAAGKVERGAADERAVQIYDGRVKRPHPFAKKNARGWGTPPPTPAYLSMISCSNSELTTSRISWRFSATCCACCLPPMILSRTASPFAVKPSMAARFLYSIARARSQSCWPLFVSLKKIL